MKSRVWFYRGLLVGLMIGFWIGAELFLKPVQAAAPATHRCGACLLCTAARISPLAPNSARMDRP